MLKLSKKNANAALSLVFALVIINQDTTNAEEIQIKDRETKISIELSSPNNTIDDVQRSHQEDSLVAEYSIHWKNDCLFYLKFLTLLKLLKQNKLPFSVG